MTSGQSNPRVTMDEAPEGGGTDLTASPLEHGVLRMRRISAHWRTAMALVMTLIALTPILIAIIQRWGVHYVPVADQSVLDLRIRDATHFGPNFPLSGPYSRFGWDHPGPLIYYLQAGFELLTSKAPWSIVVSNALLQGLAIIWIAFISYRNFGLRWLVAWLSVITLSYVATGPLILNQVWNPHVVFPFFCLFIVQAWVVALGRARYLVGFVVVGSLLVQTHVGYVVPVLGITAWAVVRLFVAARDRPREILRWQVWLPAGLVLALLWVVPVVIEPLRSSRSNLVALLDFYLGHGSHAAGATLGASKAMGFLASEFRWVPPWLGGSDPLNAFSGQSMPASGWWLVIPAILMIAALVTTIATRARNYRILSELMIVVFVIGLVTLAMVRGAPFPYLFYWRIIIGATCIIIPSFVIAQCLAVRRRAVPRILAVVMVAVMTVASVGFSRDVAAASGPISPFEPVVASMLRQLRAEHQPRGPVLMRFSGGVLGGAFGGVFDGVAAQGGHVHVDPALGFQFGPGRVRAGGAEPVWYVTEDSQDFSLLSTQPGAQVLAQTHPLRPSEQARLVELQNDVFSRIPEDERSQRFTALGQPLVAFTLGGIPGIPHGELDELGALNAKVSKATCLCSVISFPAALVPSWAYRPTEKAHR